MMPLTGDGTNLECRIFGRSGNWQSPWNIANLNIVKQIGSHLVNRIALFLRHRMDSEGDIGRIPVILVRKDYMGTRIQFLLSRATGLG